VDAYDLLSSHTLVLASASPRRRDLLAAARVACEVRAANVPEVRDEGEAAETYVRRLAQDKAHAIEAGTGEVILAADTTVVVDGHVLEKPADGADATRMLRLLSGRSHLVLTAICLRTAERTRTAVESTEVTVSPMTEEDIARYVASGEPMDKAGAYGIQGMFSRWVTGVNGCYFNVVGLPVSLVWRELESLARDQAAG
jgi:septum formation protein